MRTISILTLLLFAFTVADAQVLMRRVANNFFETRCYSEAIPLYEQLVAKSPKDYELLVKLGECYRETRDHKKAVKVYSQLAHIDKPSAENIWYYAQALAENEQYSDAADWYQRYSELVPENLNGVRFHEAYKNIDNYFKDSSQYRVRYLDFVNSWQSDFSPLLYKNGLLFCSARQEDGVIRRVYNFDQSSALKWYYVSDTTSILSDLFSDANQTRYVVDMGKHKNDDFNRWTSNDSDIAGHSGTTFLFDSVRYNVRPKTETKCIDSPMKNNHVGPACLSADQNTLIFTANAKERVNGIFHLKLYKKDLSNEKAQPELLPFNGRNFSCGHPAFTPDNKRLYFTSDMPGGSGGTDIYYVDHDNGFWSQPVNVREINTAADEAFPSVDDLGNLYFASNGHPGLGGLDIFKVTYAEGHLVDIENLGKPINSNLDDFGIILAKGMKSGYFSSNRKRGLSDDDIYYFSRQCTPVSVYVYNEVTGEPIAGANVVINDISMTTSNNGSAHVCTPGKESELKITQPGYESQELASLDTKINIALKPLAFTLAGKAVSDATHSGIGGVTIQLTNIENKTHREIVTDESGSYEFTLEPSSSYELVALKNHCGTNTSIISTRELVASTTIHKDLVMLCKDDIITVDNIYYDLNKATIRTDAEPALEKLADLMQAYPDMRIELRSHTDSRAKGSFNLKLSAMRAQAVVEYLAEKGITPFRMRAAGYGETHLLNKCADGVACSEEEHQVNRRTEFKILSIGEQLTASTMP